MPITNCRHFTGYKPCGQSTQCDETCAAKDIAGARILLIHLGALGAVVRSTALLAPIRRKFPRAHITWVTDAPANQLLEHHPLIDRVLVTKDEDMLKLSALKFDAAFVIDKSLKASGVLARTQADLTYGFVADAATGSILPATEAAEELWQIGLSDEKKFFENKKSEIQLTTEALELGAHDQYSLPLTESTSKLKQERRHEWSNGNRKLVIGLNTGCSDVIKAKKLTVEMHRKLIDELGTKNVSIVLLGGPEDTERNERIAYGKKVFQSPTNKGLQDGYASVAACDIVVTGDSLGMHLAIAARAYTIAWFGPTCAHEIELYGRGEKILTNAPCAPCWKRVCDKPVMCYDQVELATLMNAIERGIQACQTNNLSSSSSRPLSSAICS